MRIQNIEFEILKKGGNRCAPSRGGEKAWHHSGDGDDGDDDNNNDLQLIIYSRTKNGEDDNNSNRIIELNIMVSQLTELWRW